MKDFKQSPRNLVELWTTATEEPTEFCGRSCSQWPNASHFGFPVDANIIQYSSYVNLSGSISESRVLDRLTEGGRV